MALEHIKASTAILAAVKANGNCLDLNQLNLWVRELVRHGHLHMVEYWDRADEYCVDLVLTNKGETHLKKIDEKICSVEYSVAK